MAISNYDELLSFITNYLEIKLLPIQKEILKISCKKKNILMNRGDKNQISNNRRRPHRQNQAPLP